VHLSPPRPPSEQIRYCEQQGQNQQTNNNENYKLVLREKMKKVLFLFHTFVEL